MKVTITEGKKKTTFNMPSEWNELTLGRYMRTMKVLESTKEESEIDKAIKLVNCISDIPVKKLYNLEVKSINDLGVYLKKLFNTKPNEELKHIIKIDDVEYGFHPKLKDMTLGEFVDLETYNKDTIENLHHILSILYRPVIAKEKDKYLIEEYKPDDKRAELFKKKLTVDDFNGASVFFYDLERQLMISSHKSLIQQMKKKKKGS
tara:strand:- start:728 stop:1342 length:615 start_codon:yes stop_codon:yes gene_type:complete